MSLTYRSVKLVRGSVEISLNASPYSFVDAGWSDGGTTIEIELLIKSSTWSDVERSVSALQRALTQAAYYSQAGAGDPVYIYSKTCDALSSVAEIGATWRRKLVLGGSAHVTKYMASPTGVSAWVTLSANVKPVWLRSAAVPLIEATSGLTGYSSGGIIVTTAVEPYVRRLGWTSSTGIAARFHWVYASTGTAQVNFIRLATHLRLFWSGSGNTFGIGKGDGSYTYSAANTFTTGQIVEVSCYWTSNAAVCFVNGVKVIEIKETTITWPSLPDRYRIMALDSGAGNQTFLNAQIWPVALSDADMADLYNWGRPETELPFVISPTDGATPTPVQNTSAVYKIYNTPGDVPARLRPIVAGYTANYDALAVQVRTSGVPKASTGGPVVKFECEAGALGSNTASAADASASSGNVARFTPVNTTYLTRTTITVCASAIHLRPYQGRWRLMLQAKDNAAAIQINSIKWRYQVAGISGDYSSNFSLPSISTRCLVDLGELTLPPTAWPDGAATSPGTQYLGSYLTIDILAMNSIGSGGGTLDLDALYLVPADLEAMVTALTWNVSSQVLSLDFVSDPPAPCVLYSTWSNKEWAGVVTWEGHALELPPARDPDDGALLWLYAYRDISYQALPLDTIWAWLQILPGWES